MKKFLFVLLPMLLIMFQVSAYTTAASDFVIKGQVVDSVNNESVPYATIKIVMAANPAKSIKMLACDGSGKFETTLKEPGAYVLTLNSMGMDPAVSRFTLKEDRQQVNLGKINMAPASQKLSEVTVTAQRPLVKVDIDKITYNLEEDPEAITSNALDILRKVPMITVDGDDKIQLKGQTNFKIYMNGKPSNLITNNPGDVLRSMPANSIKNIEVITEPGAKYDAEGVGGIINIITKSALQGYTGSVRANADNFGGLGGSAYITLKAGKFGVTGNYGYNYRNSPYSDSYSFREDKTRDDRKFLEQNGRSKSKGPMQYGFLEASYEIDTLNLISLSANLFDGNMKNLSEMFAEMTNAQHEDVYQYDRNTTSKRNFGGTDVNLDFQHSTSLKNELLTVSYKFSNSPDGSENTTLLENIVGVPPLDYIKDWSKNKAATNEHTAQVDYTRPLGKIHTIEGGVKYINRSSTSKTDRYRDDVVFEEPNRDFKHMEHIYSAYASYSAKLKKFGFKGGVRAEGTSLTMNTDNSFSTDYFDVVPSATVSYQLGMTQNFRLGYNMRIQRPGIWYLNPYVNNSDPENISYGNVNLDSEKSHNVNFNYSIFKQKFNINASVNYMFVNNGIERYSFINPETKVLESTYDNIGHNQNVGFYLSGRVAPVGWFNLFLNGGANYQKLESDEYGDNSGFNYRIYSGAQFTLPMDFRIDLNGGYFSPRVMLQGTSSAYYFTGITLNKDFLKKKLSVSVSCTDPFWKTKDFKSVTEDKYFIQKSVFSRTARSFRFSVSYRFGDLKSAIKKVQRGISNDDMKSGGSSEGSGSSM